MNFPEVSFSWHSTIKIRNNHIFIILLFLHDRLMVFNPFDSLTAEKFIPKVECGRDFLILKVLLFHLLMKLFAD